MPEGVTEIAPFAFGNLTGWNYLDYDAAETPENRCQYYEISLPEFGERAYGSVIDWVSIAETRAGEDEQYFNELTTQYQELTETSPLAYDEIYADFVLHFLDTHTYTRTKESITGRKEDISIMQQGSITGHTGSAAQTFARKNQLAFHSLDGIPETPGDLNNDGRLDILDVITLNRVILGKEHLTAGQEISADINQDGRITAADSLAMLRRIVGIE